MVKHGDKTLLYSLDNLIEDTHFTSDLFSPYDIGWKSAAANISDICAMGGKPLYMMLGLGLPAAVSEDWIESFYKGLNDCSQKHGGAIVIGGDLCKADKISISVAIIGEANPAGVLLRSGAKPGYKLCVTGKFGNAKSFLDKYLAKNGSPQNEAIDFSEQAIGLDLENRNLFLRPEPRYKEAQAIWEKVKDGALIDSSDGLAVSMLEIAEQSGLKLVYDSHKLPRDNEIDLDNALFGGEEYELVGCFPEIPDGFCQIGHTEAGNGVIEANTGELLTKSKCYKHFEDE